MVARRAAARARCREVALQQRDAGALDRHVGARAHGDADIGCGQRRRVVDAVAGHGDDAALRLRARATMRALVLRQHARLATSSMPSWRATASAVVRLSPVSHDDVACRAAASARERRRVPSALIGSATAMRPASLPSMATNITVSPSRPQLASASAVGAARCRRRAAASAAALPSATARPPTRPRRPCR